MVFRDGILRLGIFEGVGGPEDKDALRREQRGGDDDAVGQ